MKAEEELEVRHSKRVHRKCISFENSPRKKIFKVKAVSSEKPKRQSRIKQRIINRGIKRQVNRA